MHLCPTRPSVVVPPVLPPVPHQPLDLPAQLVLGVGQLGPSLQPASQRPSVQPGHQGADLALLPDLPQVSGNQKVFLAVSTGNYW